jgi:hypothetical protein
VRSARCRRWPRMPVAAAATVPGDLPRHRRGGLSQPGCDDPERLAGMQPEADLPPSANVTRPSPGSQGSILRCGRRAAPRDDPAIAGNIRSARAVGRGGPPRGSELLPVSGRYSTGKAELSLSSTAGTQTPNPAAKPGRGGKSACPADPRFRPCFLSTCRFSPPDIRWGRPFRAENQGWLPADSVVPWSLEAVL